MMKIIGTTGNDDIATVYLAELHNGRYIEFVESKISGKSRDKKWVIILSTLAGCPIGCPMCDAGAIEFKGKLSKDEILDQIRYLVDKRYPDGKITSEKFKIQFTRVGEPSLNPAVIEVLEELPGLYKTRSLIPSLSSIAPKGSDKFFDQILLIKEKYYRGRFQLQFSIHSTSESVRKKLIPIPYWPLEKISAYGNVFFKPSDKKITLNFVAMKDVPINADIITDYFSPDRFLIKITPLNPTIRSGRDGLKNALNLKFPESFEPAHLLKQHGFNVILNIGELEENKIGSNCGQYIKTYKEEKANSQRSERCAYTYPTDSV